MNETGKKEFIAELMNTSREGTKEYFLARLLVDVARRQVYLVPENIDHLDFADDLEGVKKEDLLLNPEAHSHFVGAVVEVSKGVVTQILVGSSSFELWLKSQLKQAFHRREDVDSAAGLVEAFFEEKGMLADNVKVQRFYL